MPEKKMTVGECHKKALADNTKYDSREVGEHLTKDVLTNLWECVKLNKDFLDIPQFCIVQLLCDDCLINNAKRMKYYAWPFLPKPRPRQNVFLYDRRSEKIRRLWSLPTAPTMEWLYQTIAVPNEWKGCQRWARLYYDCMWPVPNQRKFYEEIRKESNIDLLSESEHIAQLKLMGKTGDSIQDQFDCFGSESFDFDKALGNEFIASS